MFFRPRVPNPTSRALSLQNTSATCLNASGLFFVSKLNMEKVKTIVRCMISILLFFVLFVFEHFGELCCQPFGENIVLKHTLILTNVGKLALSFVEGRRMGGKSVISFTCGWKRIRLFVYSAGRALVLRSAPTTRITTKWAVRGASLRLAEGSPVYVLVLLSVSEQYCLPAQ